jgi:hypothetical protein
MTGAQGLGHWRRGREVCWLDHLEELDSCLICWKKGCCLRGESSIGSSLWRVERGHALWFLPKSECDLKMIQSQEKFSSSILYQTRRCGVVVVVVKVGVRVGVVDAKELQCSRKPEAKSVGKGMNGVEIGRSLRGGGGWWIGGADR